MVVIFTDASRSALQGLYLLLGAQDPNAPSLRAVTCGENIIIVEKPEIEAIVVDVGVCPQEKSIENVLALLDRMELDIPVYRGEIPDYMPFISPEESEQCMTIEIPDVQRKKHDVYDVCSLPMDEIDAIVLGPLTSVAFLLEQGRIASVTMPTSDIPQEHMSIYLNPDAYEYVKSTNVPIVEYSVNEITNEKLLIARMMGMSSPVLYSLIPKDTAPTLEDSISMWRFEHLIFAMELLGYL